MPGQLAYRLSEIIIRFIDGFLIRFGGLAYQHSLGQRHNTQAFADSRVIRYPFRNDVFRPSERILRRLHTELRVNISLRQVDRVGGVRILPVDFLGQGFQPLLSCHRGARLAFGPEWTINILNLGQGHRTCQCCRYFVRHAARSRNEVGNLLPAFLQTAQIVQTFCNLSQRLVV